MEKQIIVNYIISGKEIGVVKKVLDYAYHRLKYHPEAGIQKILTLPEVEQLRKEIK